MERMGDRSAAGGSEMKAGFEACVWKSWLGLALVLALVGITLAQAPHQGGPHAVKSVTRGAFPCEKPAPKRPTHWLKSSPCRHAPHLGRFTTRYVSARSTGPRWRRPIIHRSSDPLPPW